MTDISQIMSKSSFTVKELKDECKKRGIKGYSKLKKKELIDKIMDSVQLDTDDIGLKKETNIISDDTQEKKSTLHYDIDFKYLGMKADLDEDGVYLSSKKTVMIEDTHGTQYKVTIEAID